jgi:UPF0271 protein
MYMDLNCDMGESFGRYSLGCDVEVMPFVTSANIACGFHAGDPLVMEQTIRTAQLNGVGLGAHPGYRDLAGFGRRRIDASFEEVRGDILYQVGALAGMAKICDCKLQHVKPHGALYNHAHVHEPTAEAIVQAMSLLGPELILVILAGPGGEMMRGLAEAKGIRCAREAFADRSYTAEGRLTPRGTKGAVIHDPELVAKRCLRMAEEGVVESIDGKLVELKADTICVHGDNDSAVELVTVVKGMLEDNGVELKPMGQWL